ncbi:MAG: hypothetical protein MUE33_10265 [Cytophagaceae bacterium]|jgi:hypothetical protein|nr:hypothetical protein [Cytophagaceae bacterium]
MKNSTLLQSLLCITILYLVSFTSVQAAPKLYFYPDTTQEVNTTIGIAPGYVNSLLLHSTYLPGKNITITLVRGQRPVTTNKVLTPGKDGRTVLIISDMLSKAQEGDRLVISYSVYNIVIPITEKAKDVTPGAK